MVKQALKSVLNLAAGTVGWKLTKRGDKKLIILMYHRILPKDDPRYAFEEPGMVVSDVTFRMHMQTLKEENVPVLTVTQWLAQVEEARAPLTIAITFDDGWLDNYEYAFPVLKEFGFPSTLYVVTDFLGKPAPFWPNKVLRLLLDTRSDKQSLAPLLALADSAPDFPLSRDRAAAIVHRLKAHSDDTIYQVLSDINMPGESPREMVSLHELIDARSNMGVEVGCHTRRHYRLTSALSYEKLEEEIIESQQILRELTGNAPQSFCFPNGDYSDEALTLVQQTYQNAVTTKRGHNAPPTNKPHELVRIGVHDDISGTPVKFKARLSGLI